MTLLSFFCLPCLASPALPGRAVPCRAMPNLPCHASPDLATPCRALPRLTAPDLPGLKRFDMEHSILTGLLDTPFTDTDFVTAEVDHVRDAIRVDISVFVVFDHER